MGGRLEAAKDNRIGELRAIMASATYAKQKKVDAVLGFAGQRFIAATDQASERIGNSGEDGEIGDIARFTMGDLCNFVRKEYADERKHDKRSAYQLRGPRNLRTHLALVWNFVLFL